MDMCEWKILALSGDFDEQLSEWMKAAILISTLPSELRDAILLNPDRIVEYQPTKARATNTVETKFSVRSPDELEVDCIFPNSNDEDGAEELQALGRGSVHCRCG